jgi:hypothetical protein
VFQIGFPTSKNFPKIFLNFYLIVLSYFLPRVFLIQKIAVAGSHLSASLSPHQGRQSARHFHVAATHPGSSPHRAIKAPADSAVPTAPLRYLSRATASLSKRLPFTCVQTSSSPLSERTSPMGHAPLLHR